MKKVLPFIFVLFFGLQIKAQMWCAPGATWHYKVYIGWPQFHYIDGHIKLTVSNTVTINNIVCYNMNGVFKGAIHYTNGPIQTYTATNFQTYENNKVVYIYNADSLVFDTIANFNANIGDKWLGIKYPNSNCSSQPTNYVRPIVTVIDTGHIVINNVSLKKLKVSVLSSWSTYTVNMIEKISCLSGFLFNYSHCIIDGPYYGSFSCYKDDNFSEYNPDSVVCDYVPPAGVGVIENSISNSIFKLYPNPTNGIFSIELNEPVILKIYSATGALVYERTFDEIGNFQLDISHLSNGIYHLRTESKQGVFYSKLVKE